MVANPHFRCPHFSGLHRDELILNEIVLGQVALRVCAKLSQLHKKAITKVREEKHHTSVFLAHDISRQLFNSAHREFRKR